MDTLRRIFASDPWQREASAALKEVRRADASRRPQVAADAFARVQAAAGDDGARLVAAMTRAAAAASSDAVPTYQAGLRAIASGTSSASGPIAAAALALIESADRPQQRTAIAKAVLREVADHAPDPRLRAQGALLARLADAPHYWDSAAAGVTASLQAMSGAGDYLGLLAWSMMRGDGLSQVALEKSRRGSELRALALAATRQGVVDDQHDDRRALALEGVAFLAAQGDAAARLAKDVLAGTRYRDTSRAVAEAALEGRAGATVTALAGAAHDMMTAAYAGEDGSRWVDEKTPLAATALDFMAREAGSDGHKRLAGLARDMVRACGFTKSGVAVAELAFARLKERHVGDADIAGFVLDAVSRSIAGENASDRYVDDQSPAARLGAEALADHAAGGDARKWAALAREALTPSKFTKSNVAIARAVLPAIRDSRPFDDRSVAKVVAKMLDGCLNAENASHKFQPDKSTVARAVLPFLGKSLAEEGSRRVRALWETAIDGVHFAQTTDDCSQLALEAMADGGTSDRQLAKLAGEMVDRAVAGENARYAYQDDKTGVALRAARWLSQQSKDEGVKATAQLFLEAMDGVTFTDTSAGLADVAFDAAASLPSSGGGAGKPLDGAAIARLGRKMMDRALASQTSSYKYVDDKTVVGLNVLDAAARATPSDDALTLIAVVRGGVAQAKYTQSTVKALDRGLEALASGRTGRRDIANLATEVIKAGTVTDTHQDQGPMAVGVFKALAAAETRSAQAALAWDVVRAMMDTGADHGERVRVAEAALDRWAASSSVDALDLLRSILPAAGDEEVRRRLAGAAVVRLAAERDDQARQDAAEVVSRTRTASPARDVEYLLGFIEELRKRPTRGVDVEKMAERLNQGPRATDPRVEKADEYVIIAGVRVRKREPGAE